MILVFFPSWYSPSKVLSKMFFVLPCLIEICFLQMVSVTPHIQTYLLRFYQTQSVIHLAKRNRKRQVKTDSNQIFGAFALTCVRERTDSDTRKARERLWEQLGQVQTPLHSCAEPSWWIKYGKRATLNKFGTAVLVWCGKALSPTESVELNLGSTHGAPSESDVAPVSLQSRTYAIKFGTWKVPRLNQA